MIKQAGSIAYDFLEKLKKQQEEREEEEKAAWEAMSESERQAILDERERQTKEAEARARKQEREDQIKKWRRQGVTPRYFKATWENWIADTPEKEKALRNAKTAWNTNLLFSGNNGTGKTHLAMCLAKDGATYRRLSDIFREVRDDFDSETELLNFYGECRLLVIDEIGRQKFSPFEVNLFFEIIDRRWNNILPTTIITNLTSSEFETLYSQAILDRLRPTKVNFDWESARGGIQ